MTFAVGIDVGSQSIKGVLIDGDGVTRGSASCALTMSHPHGGWAEQDPGDFENGIASVVAAMLASSGVDGADVGALCLACQVDGVVPLSPAADPLGPAIIWLDRRADVQAHALAPRVGPDRLFGTDRPRPRRLALGRRRSCGYATTSPRPSLGDRIPARRGLSAAAA